jgi:hypothetical protein
MNSHEEARHFTHGSGGALADSAPDAEVTREDHDVAAPHAKPAKPLKPGEKPDQLAQKEAASEDRDEARLDEAIEETFPASDAPSAHHIT